MRSHAPSALYVLTAGIAAWLSMPVAVAAQSVSAGGPSAAASTHGSTTISGAAFHMDNTPVPHAKLRLRNIETGALTGAAEANGAGQFVFKQVMPGMYIVELVASNARITAISNVLLAARGESLTTFVRETGKSASLRDLFANSSLAIASAAAAMGVTAVSPQAIRPVSPQK